MIAIATTQAIVAASYERVSTLQQSRYGYSLAAQHQSTEEFAATHGWELPEHLRFRDGVDDNASGTDWDLPGLTAMLNAAKEGRFTVLIVPDPDRFARSMVKGLVIEEQINKYGARVIFQRLPLENTPEGRLLRNQLYSFAEYEREKFILRSAMGRHQKAREGKVVGQSVAPFGYRYVYDARDKPYSLEPDPTTAPLVVEALHLLLEMSCQDVANIFNERDIPTPRNRRWTTRQVWRLANHPVYLGQWRFGGLRAHDRRIDPEDRPGIMVEVPALIDRPTWDRVQKAISRRKVERRGRKPLDQDPYLLRGMLTCGHCRGAMHTDVINGRRYYGCLRHKGYHAHQLGKPKCDLPSANADALEAELWRVVISTLLAPEHLAAALESARAQRDSVDTLRQERLAALDTELGRQRKRLDALAGRMVDAGDELYAALRRQALDIEKLLTRLRDERAEMVAMRADGLSDDEVLSIQQFVTELEAGIEHSPPAQRRKVFDLLQLRGTLHADPNGVRLTRRTRFAIDWQAVIQLQDSVTSLTRMGIPS